MSSASQYHSRSRCRAVPLPHQLVMALGAGHGRRVRLAAGLLEDGQLGLCDRGPRLVHPGQGVGPLAGPHVDQSPPGRALPGAVRPGGVGDGRQRGHGGEQRGIAICGVLPDLVGIGGEVHLALVRDIQGVRPLVVQVQQRADPLLLLEESLVGPDHLGVLPQPREHAAAQADDPLHPLRGQEAVDQDPLGALSNAVNAARPLDQPDDRPGQVVVHYDVAVLQVLPLREHIGRHQYPQLFPVRQALPIARGAEARGVSGGIGRIRRHPRHPAHAAGGELAGQVAHGVRELREHQHLLVRVVEGEEPHQGRQLGVSAGVP